MRSVLIVDDERIEREGIAALLQMGNYNLEILIYIEKMLYFLSDFIKI